ncbi:MAG: hypothetical protein JW819_03725 [Candidatus Krumholzibacteriota bacterium]|nr:hypothetical protein [Candidatus Krumholzibacteriota bacterium]
MTRRPLIAWLLIPLALLLGSCSEELTEPEPQLSAPDSLRGTVGDTLRFLGFYLGDWRQVARHSWDFNSDGIFDYVWTNYGGFGYDYDDYLADAEVSHIYAHTGTYTATFQVTTVGNRLYRATSRVTITNEVPFIEATLADSVGCGEEVPLWGRAVDDAGLRAFWDLNGDGSPDLSQTFTDSIELSTSLAFDEPGIYAVAFGASDNDGHLVKLEFEITVGVPPSWESGASMAEPRADHAAAVWNDRIYVFGGRHNGLVRGGVEIYDPVADTWSAAANPLPTPRWDLAAVTIADRIYVIGGLTESGHVFDRLEIFDPAAETWTTFDPPAIGQTMPIPKLGFSAAPLSGTSVVGDSILVFGGIAEGAVNDTSLVYNTATDLWSIDAAHFMRTTRAWMATATVWRNDPFSDGRLVAAGGSPDGSLASGGFESYDPFTDLWLNQTVMPTPRYAAAAAFSAGKLYVMGGLAGTTGVTGAVEVYNYADERWTPAADLPAPRAGAAAVALNGRVYLIGGGIAATPYNVEGSADLQILVPWRCSP